MKIWFIFIPGESNFQGGLRRWLPLHPLPRLRRLRHAPSVQVFPGAMPQHGGLLHITAHWEEDLHALHGDLFCCLHPDVHLWDGLPHLQARPQTHYEEERGGEKAVRRESRDGTSGSTKVRAQVQIIYQGGSNSFYPRPQHHHWG